VPATRQIALLRGINVGSHNRVPMPGLRDLLARLGYEDVATYVQSGNIVMTSAAKPAKLEQDLQRAIAAEFGVDTPVVVRTSDELASVVERDPLGDLVTEPKRYQVNFLSGPLGPDATARLEALDIAPERVVVDGREVYSWHPEGIQRSKLARALGDARLGVVATARNWNTVTKLLELARQPPP
jgi:uncharacterized protein (DUF1697 family)